MKENPNTDELLNGFIDGQLTERQHIELQRLFSHDPEIAQRLKKLRNCKAIVGSLPHSDAPSDLVERVKAALKKRTLSPAHPIELDFQAAPGHLFFRNVLAAAAMIALVGVLAGVIYTILAPGKPAAPLPVTVRRTIIAEGVLEKAAPALTLPQFNATLQLKTDNFIAASAVVSAALEANGLADKAPGTSRDKKGLYNIACTRQGFNSLLLDLEDLWPRLHSATLFVHTDRFGRPIAVDAVTIEQVAEIAAQNNLEKRIKLAEDFAVLNSIDRLLPGKEVFAAIAPPDQALTIKPPKPRLVGPEETVEKPAGPIGHQQDIYLTIVVETSPLDN